MVNITSDSVYEVKDYVFDKKEGLSLQLKAVAEFIKSRTYRNVNREVFVTSHAGYDMHPGDSLGHLATQLNEALKNFKFEIDQKQNLWKNVVIVMGSDFGRTLNANANGGTDQ